MTLASRRLPRFAVSAVSTAAVVSLATLTVPALVGSANAGTGSHSLFAPGAHRAVVHKAAHGLKPFDAAAGNGLVQGTLIAASPEGADVVVIAPDGTESTLGTGWIEPAGVAVDNAGDVFVTDAGVSSGGAQVVEIAADGTQSTLVSDLPGEAVGIARDQDGNLYVSVIGGTPEVVEIALGGAETVLPFTGLLDPLGVAVDQAGDVYVGDGATASVQMLTPDGTQTSVGSGWGFPSGVAVDSDGNVFVADQLNNDAISEVTPDATQTSLPMTGLAQPDGVSLDEAGNAYVGNYSVADIYKLTPDATQTTVSSDTQAYATAVFEGLPQTITFTSTPNRPKVGHTYTVTATGGDSGNPVSFSTGPASTGCTVTSDGLVTFTHAKTCVIQADQAAGGDYTAATATQSFSVAKGNQKVTITSAAPAKAKVGHTYKITATGGPSGRRVRFLASGACSVRSGLVTFLHPGTCRLVATQNGDSDWLPGKSTQTIEVIKKH